VPTLRKQLDLLLATQSDAFYKAFLASAAQIKSGAQIEALKRAVAARDISAAIAALNLEPAAYAGLIEAQRTAYGAAGAVTIASQAWKAPDLSRVVVRWDLANPRAEQWLATQSSRMIALISQQQRAAVSAVINQGYAIGAHPNTIALDIVGRIGANKKRVGGIINMTEPQASAVASMRSRLASGNPQMMAKALEMTRRDRRFDGVIKKAIAANKPLTQKQIDSIVTSYGNRMLMLRGETVARTETAMAVEAARREGFMQGIEKTGLPVSAVKRTWLHGGAAANNGEREQHVAMHRVSVTGMNESYVLPDGARMMHPLDASLGAGADQIVNCRCTEVIEIDYASLAV
jgi:hypothetical protein